MPIPEPAWQQLRAFKERKLNDACKGILQATSSAIACDSYTPHQAYRKVLEILASGDRDIAEMFNDLKRSNAVRKLALWRTHGLLTDEDMAQFSKKTRAQIDLLTDHLTQ